MLLGGLPYLWTEPGKLFSQYSVLMLNLLLSITTCKHVQIEKGLSAYLTPGKKAENSTDRNAKQSLQNQVNRLFNLQFYPFYFTHVPSKELMAANCRFCFIYASPSWWHILPACHFDPQCKSIMQTSGNNIDWTLMAEEQLKFIIVCYLPLCLSDWSTSSPLSLLWGSHRACRDCFSSILWLISNYSISAEIWRWPTLSRGPYTVLLWFIKLFSVLFFLNFAASLLWGLASGCCDRQGSRVKQ